MKIVIVKNKISNSLKTRLKEVVKFFDGVIDIEFTEEKSNFKNIPQSKYDFVHVDNTHKYYYSVDETWYDENISKPYQKQGYDVSILLLRERDWQYNVYNYDNKIDVSMRVAGFGTMDNDWGIEEISMPYDTRGAYNFNGVKLKGDKLTWTIIHELFHRFYEMKGLTDNTHKYFLEGKPEKCLEDFKENTKVILTRVLRCGSRGDDVKELQKLLKINADGIFGRQTEKAVKSFQLENGLVADGIVGQKTIAKLLS